MKPDDLAAKPLDRAPILARWAMPEDLVLAVTLNNGGWDLWVLDMDFCDCDRCVEARHTGDASSASAPHEQLGTLPPLWADRLALGARPRCGRLRRDGEACRSLVADPGDACYHHREGRR